jgi:alpha/beta superfamily hydrolase
VAAIQKHNANVELRIIKGADHFFAGRLEELKQGITDWLRRRANF